MMVLGIESTCDETACAVVKDGHGILSNIVSSQIDLHRAFGGVVPELACRRHIDDIIPVLEESLKTANVTLDNIDLIAVAHGPGLIGALLIGINVAKGLSLAKGIPFIAINHIEAHLYAALMSQPTFPKFPCLGVVLSGGHTALVVIHDVGDYQLIGETVDDAIGEAFDKVGKLLDLPYPGGPQIEELAKHGNPFVYELHAGKVKGKEFHFSFSGLKTKVLYTLKGQNASRDSSILSDQQKADLAASFQHAAFIDVITKTAAAGHKYSCKTVVLGGGVTCNQSLRKMFADEHPEFECLWPTKGLSLDNAAMIAGLGYHVYRKRGCGDPYDLPAETRIPFG